MVQAIDNSSSNAQPALRRSQSSDSRALEASPAEAPRISRAEPDSPQRVSASSKTADLRQSTSSTTSAISLGQVAEQALSSIRSGVENIQQLSRRAASDTASPVDRQQLQGEVKQQLQQLNDTANNTSFEQRSLLSDQQGFNFDDAEAESGNHDSSPQLQLSSVGSSLASIAAIDITSATGARQALSSTELALDSVRSNRDALDAFGKQLDGQFRKLQSELITNNDGPSITDPQRAQQLSELVASQAQKESGIALDSQANANAGAVMRALK